MEKAKKEGEQKLSFRFVLTRSVIENSKKIAIKFRKFQNTIVVSFQAIISWNSPKKRENKNCRSVPFRSNLTHNLKFQKNRKKFKKN